jgi:glycosyltransferase involved in cell wall biosynthesis
MRMLLWHGWLMSGSGSNVYTARVAEALRRAGHDVLILCQEPHPEGLPFVDEVGRAGGGGVRDVRATGAAPAPGRVVLLRPDIGSLLPVFVYDEYEGFEVKRFVDLTEAELTRYLDANVAALRASTAWHDTEAVVAGHLVPGFVVAARALGEGPGAIPFAGKVHGSDIEYTLRPQERYRTLAAEGVRSARAILGATGDVLDRTVELVPDASGVRRLRCPPGVDTGRFRAGPRTELLLRAAALLEEDGSLEGGRPAALDDEVAAAEDRRDLAALDALATRYDQTRPDLDAPAKLRALAEYRGPLVGYLGKLIPQKGVELLIAATAALGGAARTLVIGFGAHRERLEGLVDALDRGNPDVVAALWRGDVQDPPPAAPPGGLRGRITFSGRLDHRYASLVVGAMDVLVVPSILKEAFGMVAAEGAAAGALPLVARHSGLAEVASALEGAAGRPGLFSFEPGPGALGAMIDGLRRLLELAPAERDEIAAAVRAYVTREWSWDRTAECHLAPFASAGAGTDGT